MNLWTSKKRRRRAAEVAAAEVAAWQDWARRMSKATTAEEFHAIWQERYPTDTTRQAR